MGRQLALELRTDTFPSFDAYLPVVNGEALAALEAAMVSAQPGVIYLWGPAGSGKTHLLQAACVGGRREGIYLPCADLACRDPQILDGLESRGVVCLDDLGTVAGLRAWEEALFHLFNRVQGSGTLLVLADRQPPRGLGLSLPDLLSRLVGGLTLALEAPADDQLTAILRAMAGRRGLQLNDDVLRYLISRERRDLGHLAALLERLDSAALAAQRRLTIPLIRSVLDGPSGP